MRAGAESLPQNPGDHPSTLQKTQWLTHQGMLVLPIQVVEMVTKSIKVMEKLKEVLSEGLDCGRASGRDRSSTPFS